MVWKKEKVFPSSFEFCFSSSYHINILLTFLNFQPRKFPLRKLFFFSHTLLVVYLECKYMIYHFITTFYEGGRERERQRHGGRWNWNQKTTSRKQKPQNFVNVKLFLCWKTFFWKTFSFLEKFQRKFQDENCK